MNRSEDNYVYLIKKIDGFIRKYYLNKVVKGSIFLASSFFAAYLILSMAEYLGHFNQTIRSVLFFSFITGNLFVLATYIIYPLLAYFRLGNTINHEQASIIIGEHFSPIKDKLLNTLQLKQQSELNEDHKELIDASINQKLVELKPVPFNSAIHIQENSKYLKYLLAPVAVIILLFFTAPSILSESTERLINYNKHFIKKAPFHFEILNEQLDIVQGSDFTLMVKLVGDEIPAELYLEDGSNTFKLNKESIIRFNYTFNNLQKNKKIRLIGGEFKSEEYLLLVKPRPTLLNFNVFITYPAYLNKSNEKLENTGDLQVPEGSQIKWEFKAQNSNQIDVLIGKQRLLLNESEKNLFSLSHRAMNSLTYSVKPINKAVKEAELVSYELKVIPDLSPVIEVTEKPDSLNSKLIYFVGQASDDHGFSKLNFNYRVLSEKSDSSNRKHEIISIQFDKNALQSNFFHVWNVNDVNANAGDQIEYYFELFDNDGVNGPKSVKSVSRTFKIPSQKELAKQIDENSEQVKKGMEQAIKMAGQIEKEAKKLNQSLLEKKTLSFEERKQIENVLNKQQELENLVQEIQKQNKQNSFDKQEQNEQILEKQKQIEELFNNVLDEKTREILKNIEALLEKNNKNLTQEELSKMQMDNKSLQKELDRILELYKQLEFDQKLNKSIEKLNELAIEQEKLSIQSQERKTDLEILKKDQSAANQDFTDLKKELEELDKKNKELDKKNNFDLNQESLDKIEQEQQKSTDQLKVNDKKSAAENQKSAANEMKKLSKELESMQQDAEEKESDVNVKSLREILDNLLKSSFNQENIMKTIRSTNINDPSYILQTQNQKDIQVNMKMIEDSLYSLSKKVPQIQSVVNKEVQTINFNIQKAIESLAERRSAEAGRNQQFAMTSMNNLALMLNEALEQLQKAQQNAKQGGKGKKKQSLSQLSKMQEQLNKNMQKAREEMQKQGQQQNGQQGKSKQEISAQLAKLAREQQMIRQAMQEINKLENKDGRKGLGNLEKLMKEMEQTETDLVNKKIQQETINRQQEILSKLLEAEKADRERDQDEQRESREGIKPPEINAIIMQEFKKIKQNEIDLLKTVPASLNSFYKIKVGEYFKYLNSGDK